MLAVNPGTEKPLATATTIEGTAETAMDASWSAGSLRQDQASSDNRVQVQARRLAAAQQGAHNRP